MKGILTDAAEQVLAEARTIAESATRCLISRRYLSSNYAQAHFNAQSFSARVAVPVAVTRRAERFLSLSHTYGVAELAPACELGCEVVAVYENGVRRPSQSEAVQGRPCVQAAFDALMEAYAQQIEDEEIAQAARELAAEAAATEAALGLSNRELLDLDWLYGYVQPAKAPVLVLLERQQAVTRSAYCEMPGANKAAWKQELGWLWEALKLAGLSPERHLRLAGASLILGFEVTSYRVLKPRELRAIRLAVEARRFYSNWTLIPQQSAPQQQAA